ncbi:MAG TPA: methyltransferase domain-containing protein [Candidatus Gastranaerophilaceae bacterium]|nr:methyltransferase domain-containing protein [Candidatus Gastranaerophilaceae bacterium]
MSYRGKKLLKIMQNANNYNNFVINLILKSIVDKNFKTLDFGAGYGFFANLLRKSGVSNIKCVEIDEELSEHCKNLDFFVFKNLHDIENNSYDFIYTLNVLEHIRDDKAVLLALKAKLKKEGKIFIYVPAFKLLYSSFDKKIRHCRRYKKEDLIPFLENNGFEILNAKYVDSFGFFLALIYKFINKNDGEINMLSVKIFDKILFPVGRIFDKIIFEKFLGKNLIVEAKLIQ